jgi:hypothetical protein
LKNVGEPASTRREDCLHPGSWKHALALGAGAHAIGKKLPNNGDFANHGINMPPPIMYARWSPWTAG